MTDADATIIIPNYNGMRFLPDLMASLKRQSLGGARIIVVDDASTDDGCAYLRSEHPTVTVLRNERNLGFAGTCNAGLRAATTTFVVLLNNDTTVDEDWLAAGLAAFDAPDIAAVASLVVLAEPPHRIDTAGDVYSVVGAAAKRCHGRPRESARDLPREVFSACGASAFYRRERIAQLGCLDERMVSYYEDVDMGFRLAWAGLRCVFEPRSVCYHRLSASYDPRGWNYHFNSARNAEIIWQTLMPQSIRDEFADARRAFLAIQAAHKWRLGCLKAHRAGRRAAAEAVDWIAQKRADVAKLAGDSGVTAEQIAARLERDWWRLHGWGRR
ncbi:MAG: glycosyl transferase [Phycisphaerae bacterium]|nr:MAG: glycosyltransferase family 2 protein [Planctomycetia bacterium]RIK71265.1 MAG: glycosyltransferase family 2 protein [Planctomycetota bacterium]GJQ26377.1 MAG: glycosyl transferase [Phycisphaerae bacterium]